MQTRIIKATGFLFLCLMQNKCAEVNVLTKTFVLSFKHLTAAGCQCVKKIHLLIAKFSFYYFSCVPIHAKPFSFFFNPQRAVLTNAETHNDQSSQ
uniref:Secreted protein n=1 Tax=Rhipicephalus appendiculatus TaxID=34631 RepID=A0A131YBX6_RHIAP